MNRWLCLAAAIASEVSATLALRAATDHSGWIAFVIAGYGASFVLMAALTRTGMPIGVVYGIWAASGVSLTALGAAALFGDPVTWLMGVGFAAIIGGVLLIELGAHPGQPNPLPAAPPPGGVR